MSICPRCYDKKTYYGKNLTIKNCTLCSLPEVDTKDSSGLALELGSIISIANTRRGRGRPKKVRNAENR